MKEFKVAKKFTDGALKGIEYTETTSVEFTVGQVVDKPVGGSPYIIIAVEPMIARKPQPTDISCRRCGDAVPLRVATQTSGYHEGCQPQKEAA